MQVVAVPVPGLYHTTSNENRIGPSILPCLTLGITRAALTFFLKHP